jgi:hypothetical protein
MVKPVGDYHPPEGWVEFSTLKSGAKFHNIVGDGSPTQYVKLVCAPFDEKTTHLSKGSRPRNAVNTDTGKLVRIDENEFVYPIDAGWIAEISCYGIEIPDEIKAKGHRAILAHVFSQCESRKADNRWREEIEKYYPELGMMSWSGAERTIAWLMERCKEGK